MRKGQRNPKLAELNRSLEHRIAVSLANKGQRLSPQTEFKKGNLPPFKGKHLPEGVKRKKREALKGWHISPDTELKKGHTPWNKGLTGYSTSLKGGKQPEKARLKMIASLKGRHLHPETEIQKRQRISPKTELTSERVKSWWKDPEYRAKVIAGRLKNRRPTGPEKELIGIIERHNLPFKYTGDGSFILEGLNPDFVNTNGRKLAIDVFGNYWHTLKADKESYREDGRKAIFSKYGWELIIIWDHELKTLSETAILERIKGYG